MNKLKLEPLMRVRVTTQKNNYLVIAGEAVPRSDALVTASDYQDYLTGGVRYAEGRAAAVLGTPNAGEDMSNITEHHPGFRTLTIGRPCRVRLHGEPGSQNEIEINGIVTIEEVKD